MNSELYKRLHFYLGNLYRFATIPLYQINIRPKEARTIFGVSFAKNGWHHVVKTLEEYDHNPELNYKESSLFRFLKYFEPSSIFDLLDKNIKQKPFPLFLYPWGSFKINQFKTNKVALDSRFCGPSSDQFIESHFNHVIKLYNSLKAVGYKPWIPYNGFIGGTLLIKSNGERIFVALQGNHRLAILCHLKYKTIKVRNVPGYLRVVKESQLKNLYFVKNGFCTLESCKEIFYLFFKNKGSRILKDL